jgi:hypothetical protein
VGCSCGLTGVSIKQSLLERASGLVAKVIDYSTAAGSRNQQTWLLDPCMRLTKFGKAIGKGLGLRRIRCLLLQRLGWTRDVGEGRPGDVSHIHSKAMTRKAGRERSILGTEVEKPK